MEPINDPLWEVAKKRANFKKDLIKYIIVVPFLWVIWLFTSYNHFGFRSFNNIPWPAWVTLFWGIGLAFKFADAYVLNTKQSIENEYENLKNQNK